MNVELVRTFSFDAAHRLTGAPDGHKCRNLHGHSYRVDIHIAGPVDEQAGWLMDFHEFKAVVNPVIDRLDHACLNEIPGLENPTSERLAGWLWDQLKSSLPTLTAITIWESDASRCIYRGPETV